MTPAELRRTAYLLDPALWAEAVLGWLPHPFQARILRSPRGSRWHVKVARQHGKTESAAALLAHAAVFWPGSTSVVIAPTQRQAAEAVRRCRRMLLKARAALATDNAFTIEVHEGGRIVALPGADDSAVRGLSIENGGIALIDEASRVSDELFRAVTPMLARHADTARLIAISTPWIKGGFFYELDRAQDEGWSYIAVRASEAGIVPPAFLAAERRVLGERAFMREYELEYDSTESLFFDRDAIAAAFGGVEMPAPAEPVGDPDPVLHRERAFSGAAL